MINKYNVMHKVTDAGIKVALPNGKEVRITGGSTTEGPAIAIHDRNDSTTIYGIEEAQALRAAIEQALRVLHEAVDDERIRLLLSIDFHVPHVLMKTIRMVAARENYEVARSVAKQYFGNVMDADEYSEIYNNLKRAFSIKSMVDSETIAEYYVEQLKLKK